jgi:zona occludens toxin
VGAAAGAIDIFDKHYGYPTGPCYIGLRVRYQNVVKPHPFGDYESMIIVFEGTPGSGKTYEAVKKLMDNLRLGRVVYTNIRGLDEGSCIEAIKTNTGLDDFELGTKLRFLSDERCREFWDHIENGSLIVIDEAQRFFSNREWQSETNKKFGQWAAVHRHYGFDVVLITQNIEKVDGAVRTLTEWTYRFKKVNFFGAAIKKKYVCYSYAGDDVSGKPLGNNIRTYDEKVFRCYNSYVTKDIKELGIMKHANILRHPIFYAIPVCLLLFVVLFMRSGIGKGDIFGEKAYAKRIEESKMKSIPEIKDDGTIINPEGQKGESGGKVNKVENQVQGSENISEGKKAEVEENGQKRGSSSVKGSSLRTRLSRSVEGENGDTDLKQQKVLGEIDGQKIMRNEKGKAVIE